MTHLAQSLRFNLTDALTSHIELLADFFQSPRAAVIESETQAQDLFFPWRQTLKDLEQLLFEQGKGSLISRRRRVIIGDEVAQMAVFLFADRFFQGNRLLRDL